MVRNIQVRNLQILAMCIAASLWACNKSRSGNETTQKDTPSKAVSSDTTAHIQVTEKGYVPASITAKAGTSLALVFRRTSDAGCGDEVVFPEHNIRRKLPVGKDITVRLRPKQDERIAFTCGMGMYRGSVVAN